MFGHVIETATPALITLLVLVLVIAAYSKA
jgi:hypothetical protein